MLGGKKQVWFILSLKGYKNGSLPQSSASHLSHRPQSPHIPPHLPPQILPASSIPKRRVSIAIAIPEETGRYASTAARIVMDKLPIVDLKVKDDLIPGRISPALQSPSAMRSRHSSPTSLSMRRTK
ncbi:hypothetical protein CC80DRAFT_511033 [Byssothecium circinans]|uniref:Uncharacterized protein n=1 Tax=Byssothecium circinans TaxID=147558 RepID=A0A6A5T996_9PLEO|nr:hypothetical protein CC80DRAFT_511033 [Byssothecium circinans]